MSDIELALKVRDALQMAADAYNEYVEKRAPPQVKYGEKDFGKLPWADLKGNKGPFQRTSKKACNNSEIFQALQTILRDHKGFCGIGVYKYWFDNQNPDVIDRRRK